VPTKKKDPRNDDWTSVKASPSGGYDITSQGGRVENRSKTNDPKSWTKITDTNPNGWESVNKNYGEDVSPQKKSDTPTPGIEDLYKKYKR